MSFDQQSVTQIRLVTIGLCQIDRDTCPFHKIRVVISCAQIRQRKIRRRSASSRSTRNPCNSRRLPSQIGHQRAMLYTDVPRPGSRAEIFDQAWLPATGDPQGQALADRCLPTTAQFPQAGHQNLFSASLLCVWINKVDI
jgi:hypothetical protein